MSLKRAALMARSFRAAHCLRGRSSKISLYLLHSSPRRTRRYFTRSVSENDEGGFSATAEFQLADAAVRKMRPRTTSPGVAAGVKIAAAMHETNRTAKKATPSQTNHRYLRITERRDDVLRGGFTLYNDAFAQAPYQVSRDRFRLDLGTGRSLGRRANGRRGIDSAAGRTTSSHVVRCSPNYLSALLERTAIAF